MNHKTTMVPWDTEHYLGVGRQAYGELTVRPDSSLQEMFASLRQPGGRCLPVTSPSSILTQGVTAGAPAAGGGPAGPEP